MKRLQYIILLIVVIGTSLTSCKNIIDVNPISNIGSDNYYKSYKDFTVALTGCYNGLQEPLRNEWMLTELRSDNVLQGSIYGNTTILRDFDLLDRYQPSSSLIEIYDYWFAVYKNIKNINYILKRLGFRYVNDSITIDNDLKELTEDQINTTGGQALFLRAYHYFNLVRLFGGVFLVTQPISPREAQKMDRSSIEDCYKLIVADLKKAIDLLPRIPYQNIIEEDKGKANAWAAEALLAKVYLTLDNKSNALPLLDDVINSSGYGLESSYKDIFAVNNEMNKEILFAVRFKAGGIGLGNFMPNDFAPSQSGDAVVNGDGSSFSRPSHNIDSAFKIKDPRFSVSIGRYLTRSYAKKFVVPVITKDEGENDFPIIRFADILLMKAEATGYDGANGVSVNIINQIRERAGAEIYSAGNFDLGFYQYPTNPSDPNSITTPDRFKHDLLLERRLEFAFENQRLFTLIRFNVAIPTMKDYFKMEYDLHYVNYVPRPTLSELQNNVTADHLILPIPQQEIDANTTIKIHQNPGY